MNILLLIIFFEIILMKKNNGTLNSDLKNLDMKKIFNGFNCWDTIYLSCFIISIRYFDTLFQYVIAMRYCDALFRSVSRG